MRKFVHLMLVALALSPLLSRQFSFDDPFKGSFSKFSKGEQQDITSRELYDSISDALGPQLSLSEQDTGAFGSEGRKSKALKSRPDGNRRARALGQTIQIQLPDLTTEQLMQLQQLQQSSQAPVAAAAATPRDPSIFERIIDGVNYVPKQIGVNYNDSVDTNVGAAGIGALGYGVYNTVQRQRGFRKLKKRLINNFKIRQRYMASINDQTSQLTAVKNRLGSSVQRIAAVQEEVGSAVKSIVYGSMNSYN